MYLHIGKDCIINSKNIIGIFNIEYVKNTKEYKNLYKSMEDSQNINFVTDKKAKSFILTKEKGNEKAYITNIGVYTIAKRLI